MKSLLKLAAEQKHLRALIVPLLHKVAEASGRTWAKFLKEKYEGGRAQVPNPNPDTRQAFPNVSVNTALRDNNFATRLRREFRDWAGLSPEDQFISYAIGKDQDEKEDAIKAYASKNLTPQLAGATSEELAALNQYTKTSYADLNRYLRGMSKVHSDDDAKVLKELDQLFARREISTPENLSVTRGLSNEHPLAKALLSGDMRVGASYQDDGFCSTTMFSPEDWSWAEGGGLNIKIQVPKGTKAVFPGEHSEFDNEVELLLNRGLKYRLVHANTKKKEFVFRAETPVAVEAPLTKKPVEAPLTKKPLKYRRAWEAEGKKPSEAMDAFVEEYFNPLKKQFSEKAKKALAVYSGGAYSIINEGLRGERDDGKHSKLIQEFLDESWENIDTMDRLFATPQGKLPVGMNVVRGVSGGPFMKAILMGENAVGMVVTDQGYTSTSIKNPNSYTFEETEYKVNILAPKGSEAVYIGPPDSISENGYERELLINRGARFTILSVDRVNKTCQVALELPE